MRKIYIAILMLGFLVCNIYTVQATQYTIGNTVYSQNIGKGLISATPDSILYSQDVKINFTNYLPVAEQFDIAFGFNTSAAKPSSAYLYYPHVESVQKSYTCNSPYWFNYTVSPKQFWCWLNTTSDNLTWTPSIVFSHSFDSANTATGTAYWTETGNTDWLDVSDKAQRVDYNYDGKNVWYIFTNVTFQPGETKTLKTKINPIASTDDNSGKYDVFVKRTQDTLASALSNGNYVLLDPTYITFDGNHTAAWELEGNGNDATGNGRTQSIIAGSTTTGIINLGYSGIRGNATHNAVFNGASITVEAWVNMSSTASWQVFAAKAIGGADADAQFLLEYSNAVVFCTEGNQFAFVIRSNTGWNCAQAAIPGGVQINKWYYVVGELDTAGKIRIYVNGTLYNTTTISGTYQTTTTNIYLGERGTGDAGYSGSLDEVYISNINRSLSYIQNVYTTYTAPTPTANYTILQTLYTTPVTELQLNQINYMINTTANVTDINATLNYNNVVYNATKSIAGTVYNFSAVVPAPIATSVSMSILFNLTYNVTLLNGSTINVLSPISTQVVNQVGLLTSCSATDSRIVNFTFVDEQTNTILSAVNITTGANAFNANFRVYMSSPNDLGGRNYSYNMSASNSYVICMVGNSSSFYVDADINYFNTTYYSNSRWYYLRNLSISNVTRYYNLYLIPTSIATEVPILLKSADGISVASNYIVVALKQFIAANNTYVPVAMTITSSSSSQNGDFWLQTGNAIYQFNMYDNQGNLINVVPPTTISGTQIGNVISPPLSLTLGSATLSQILGYITATSKSCILSGTTFTCSYNDTSSKIQVAWLTVMKVGAATMTQSCRISNTTVPYGTLSCDLSAAGNGSYYYQLGGYYPLATTGGTYWNVLDDGSFFLGGTSPYGTEGLMFAVILIIMFAMIGSFNPVVCIFMGITGMGISVAFGMVTLSQSSLIGIAAVGIIIAVKVRG